MKYVLFAVLLLSSLSTFAYERDYFSTAKGEHIVYSYEEEDRWFLKELLIRPGKLQEEVNSFVFDSKAAMKQFKIKNYNHQSSAKHKSILFFRNTEVATKSLWKVTEKWDLNWEEKFIKWLEKDFNKDFFVKHQIVTDCADAAFALRWIFARMNGLPAANTMAGSHLLFTQDSMKQEWTLIPTAENWYEDKLFLTGLEYILRHAFTGTLGIDGYPIEMSPDAFRVGTIHLDGVHTMIISKIDFFGKGAPIWKLSSTVPAEIRVLYEEIMLDQSATDQASGAIISSDEEQYLYQTDEHTGATTLFYTDGEKLQSNELGVGVDLYETIRKKNEALFIVYTINNSQTNDYDKKVKKINLLDQTSCLLDLGESDELYFSVESSLVARTSYDDPTESILYTFDDNCNVSIVESFSSELYGFSELGSTKFLDFDDALRYMFQDTIYDLGDYSFIMKYTDFAYIYDNSSQALSFSHIDFKTGKKSPAKMSDIVYECRKGE